MQVWGSLSQSLGLGPWGCAYRRHNTGWPDQVSNLGLPAGAMGSHRRVRCLSGSPTLALPRMRLAGPHPSPMEVKGRVQEDPSAWKGGGTAASAQTTFGKEPFLDPCLCPCAQSSAPLPRSLGGSAPRGLTSRVIFPSRTRPAFCSDPDGRGALLSAAGLGLGPDPASPQTQGTSSL